MATKSYVSLDALTRYDEKIKAYLAALDAEVLLNANKNASDLVDDVKKYVGEIPAGYTEETIIAYINKKAEETLNSATGGSSESAASVKQALDTYMATNDPKVAANTEAIEAINDETDGILAQAKAYADAEDAKIEQSVSELSGKVTTLIGEDTNKSVRTISAEEVAKIVAGADESYDTLKEIADWISTHGSDAAEMNSAIVALQAIVDGIGGEGEQATVVAYVNAAIAALNIGDYAKAADLTALAARVSALETDSHTHANKAALDTYEKTQTELLEAAKAEAQGLVAAHETAVNAALEGKANSEHNHDDTYDALGAAATKSAVNVDDVFQPSLDIYNVTKAEYEAMEAAGTLDSTALYFVEDEEIDLSGYATVEHDHNDTYYTKTEVDGLNAAMDTRVKAVEDTSHIHANKTVLDGITAENVSAWDAAEQNAKDYADGLVAEFVEVTDAEIDALFAESDE